MSETPIGIVAATDRPGVSWWQATTPHGVVAGIARLRPAGLFRHDVLPRAGPPGKPGLADLGVPELSVHVRPAWRRHGIGSRLLAAVRERTAEPRLVADVVAGSAGEAFCLRHGFRHTGFRRHDLLTYRDVHRAWLGEMVDAQHPGYRLAHWTGVLPDPPRPEEPLLSPGGPGDAVLTAADSGGDRAAYAVAVVGGRTPHRARQYGPAVLPGHHGRGLGLWVNAALVQRLREVHPYVDEIETATAEDDPGLLATREHLGFRAVGRTRLYELRLAGA
ncbi:GNAT family N-acetyltransferase [Actinoplanes sp. NEAU-A12]|uniref:GNAT family N-acetyltransferase n=1 Tax=Actinoplanes sandaracinus TaxID=3045177 RepID=A0ABT6WIK1_9ACTN|nr:GNAT family N-acetyltransferase [Actinoplanes sandaracinus]MDI6099550.1 GNAT family N-acetyltransferase [Actinoplanes sandaracinus]